MSGALVPESVRAKLRLRLSEAGAKAETIDEIVDLACHAAESAAEKLYEVTFRGRDDGVTLTALQLAIPLLKTLADAQHTVAFAMARERGGREAAFSLNAVKSVGPFVAGQGSRG